MNKFSASTDCVKCGYGLATAEYMEDIGTYEYPGGADLIQRECRRCGYTWYEKPLDAEKREEQYCCNPAGMTCDHAKHFREKPLDASQKTGCCSYCNELLSGHALGCPLGGY